MTFLTFFTATYFLLAVPGPTNTLLATSGAGAGISRSLHLLAAELCGYLLAIAVLRLALGPVISDIPIAALLLRVAVTIYILCLAVMLWRVNTRELRVIVLQILTAGAAWIILGATLGRGARRLGRPDLVTRTGAVTLVAVTGLIWLQSFLVA
ncbi:hypothetical protein N2605_06970 [Bradyrhizobium yuanmingense]|uniref:hypothetical protein n=1 Tax=Bradyrhizobium yuanmingense TaxID=108015 RepID=UPI0021A4B46F|nr:hypothetical protein [Bradyrhizobium sp. CB1024]UWU86187.1 hypothetical protein N2605_06970 [Bradyrhizobium sp. CB1024]